MVAMYLIDALSSIVGRAGTIRPAFAVPLLQMGGDPLRNGLNLGDAAVLAAVVAVFLAIAWSLSRGAISRA